VIQDSLKSRRHVIEYSKDIVPTKNEVKEILEIGYSLSSSKQNSFPYKVSILGTDYARSEYLLALAEGNKIDTDGELPEGTTYWANPCLFHLGTAPYTLIISPRLAPPNAYHQMQIEKHGNHWEFDKKDRMTDCGKAFSVEVGILATTITGAAIDRGWDCAYCVCFPSDINQYVKFPYVDYCPYLILTLGKATKYKADFYKKESIAMDIRPSFEEIFKFVD
jgi:hypothetical protein